MSEFLPASPIILWVHGGVSRKIPHLYPEPERDQAIRMGKTLRWIINEGKKPQTALINISAFWDRHEGILKPDMVNSEAFWEMQSIMEDVEAVYGSRLITFGTWENPTKEQITAGLSLSGLKFMPEVTKIHALGEVLDLCVPSFKNTLAKTLGIDPVKDALIRSDLSLRKNPLATEAFYAVKSLRAA